MFAGDAVNVDDSRVGILRNAKRFNVAITRAKALMVIVGASSRVVDLTCMKQ